MSASANPCARRCSAVRVAVDEAGVGAAVGKRDPEVGVGRGDPVAVALELELGDHHRVEQADDVGAGADHEALVGERALERRRAAELLAALEHQHPLAGAREVGGGGEPVVAAADDDRVPRRAPRARRPAPAGRPARATPLTSVARQALRPRGSETPVSSRRPPTAAAPVCSSRARPTGSTTVGVPRASMNPSGPMNSPPSTPGRGRRVELRQRALVGALGEQPVADREQRLHRPGRARCSAGWWPSSRDARAR